MDSCKSGSLGRVPETQQMLSKCPGMIDGLTAHFPLGSSDALSLRAGQVMETNGRGVEGQGVHNRVALAK